MEDNTFAGYRQLAMLPATCLITMTPWLLYTQHHQPIYTEPGPDKLLKRKMVVTVLHFTMELLGTTNRLWESSSAHVSLVSTESLDIISAGCLVMLFKAYHTHEPHPSTTLSVYLAFDILAKALFLWQYDGGSPWSYWRLLIFAVLLLKIALISLQETSKWANASDEFPLGLRRSDDVGFWTSCFGLWIFPLLSKARNESLNQGDFFGMLCDSSDRRFKQDFGVFWTKYANSRHRLMRTAIASSRGRLLQATLVILLTSITQFSIPFLIEELAKAMAANRDTQVDLLATDQFGVLFALKAFAIFASLAALKSCLGKITHDIALLLRGMLTSALFDKLFVMSDRHVSQHIRSSLLTEDVDTAEASVQELQIAVTSCVNATLTIYFFWYYLEYTVIWSIAIILIGSILCSSLASSLVAAKQKCNADAVTHRTEASNVLRGIKESKMTNKESSIFAHIGSLYLKELESRRIFHFRKSLYFTLVVSVHASIPIFVVINNGLTSVESCVVVVKCVALSFNFVEDVQYILQLSERWKTATAAFSSIESVLGLPDKDTTHDSRRQISTRTINSPEPETVVEIVAANVAPAIDLPVVVRDVTLSVPRESIAVITGAVGCGKTTLLRAISGQASVTNGTITVANEKIGFCGQDIWLENKSIRDNIVGTAVFWRPWYNIIIATCVLEDEVKTLGERYVVGQHGSKLNPAQRQRIALARAIYAKPTLVFLDDVFSLQSPTVARKLVARLFSTRGLLRGHATVILTALRPAILYDVCDSMLAIYRDGTTEALNVDQLVAPPPTLLLEHTSYVEQTKEPVIEHEITKLQEISKDIAEALRTRPLLQETFDQAPLSVYFKNTSGTTIMTFAALITCTALLETFPSIFLRLWLDFTKSSPFPFVFCIAVTIISGPMFMVSYSVFHECLAKPSAKASHKRLLDALLGATISSLTPSKIEHGINLFSDGLGLITGDLANAVYRSMYLFATCIVMLVVITSFSRVTLALTPCIIILIAAIYWMQMPASLQLRQMEVKTTEAIYLDFDEKVRGLRHIVAFRRQHRCMQATKSIIRDAKLVKYHLSTLRRWRNTATDMSVALLAAVYVPMAVSIKASPWAATIGLALLPCFSIILDFYFESLSVAESSMVAIKEMEKFIREIPQEEARAMLPTPDALPQQPCIEFDNASISYGHQQNTPVLPNVTLRIEDHSQYGIFGQLGTGKTTMCLALLSFIPYTGSIKVNGLEARSIPRHMIPELFTVITQTPVVFRTATIYQNLMPNRLPESVRGSNGYKYILNRVLFGVGLKTVVDRNGGLNSRFSRLNLSYEQLQRFSVAQGLVSYCFTQTPFVLIDGITNDVDAATLARMRAIMREVFTMGNSIVISTAHYTASVSGLPWIGQLSEGELSHYEPPPIWAIPAWHAF